MPHSPSSPFLSSPTSEIKQTDNKQGEKPIFPFSTPASCCSCCRIFSLLSTASSSSTQSHPRAMPRSLQIFRNLLQEFVAPNHTHSRGPQGSGDFFTLEKAFLELVSSLQPYLIIL